MAVIQTVHDSFQWEGGPSIYVVSVFIVLFFIVCFVK